MATGRCTPWSRRLHKRNELKDKVLGLIPLGTGNDFARGTGIPLEPADAAELILHGEVRPVDLLVDELGEVVVNNVHVGVGAQASRRAARWKSRLGHVKLGRLSYPIGAAISAFRPHYARLHIELDRNVVVDVDRRVLQVALGNGSSVGGGTELTPDADPEDGRIDVMISLAARLARTRRVRPAPVPRRASRAHRCALSPRERGVALRRRVLVQRRRRDLRPRAKADLARRAGGVRDDPAVTLP